MKTKEFIGTCVENPFDRIEILCEIVENAKEITKQTFLKHCAISREQQKTFSQFPKDYVFYKYDGIYF